MKNLALVVFVLFTSISLNGQSTGVIINQTETQNGYGANIQLTGNSNFGPPFNVSWTNADGDPIQSCNSLDCNLSDEEPGRYCFTISTSNIDSGEDCEHDFATISQCIDIIGTTCEGLDGSVTADEEFLCGDQTTCVSFAGSFPECLQGNLKYTWSNGESNQFSSDHIPNRICGLGAGTHCVKITAMDENDTSDCEPACIGYFCTTVSSPQPEPLTVEAIITPTIRCFNGTLISEGSISLIIYGGLPDYDVRWLGSGGAGMMINGTGTRCVEVTDNSNCPETNKIFKCFTIPTERRICQIKDPTDGVNKDGDGDITLKSIKVYPNPAVQEIFCEFISDKATTGRLEIMNPNGSTVLNEQIEIFSGDNSKRINIQNLENGIHVLKIEDYEPFQFLIIK